MAKFPKVEMGGGVPGTPSFPYYVRWASSIEEQSDWGLATIVANNPPKEWGEEYPKSYRVEAAQEWVRRYPDPLEDAPVKSWAEFTDRKARNMAAVAAGTAYLAVSWNKTILLNRGWYAPENNTVEALEYLLQGEPVEGVPEVTETMRIAAALEWVRRFPEPLTRGRLHQTDQLVRSMM